MKLLGKIASIALKIGVGLVGLELPGKAGQVTQAVSDRLQQIAAAVTDGEIFAQALALLKSQPITGAEKLQAITPKVA